MIFDNNLFELVKNGDKKAFETLFRSFYSHLCAYANTFVHDIDEAEDLVQEFLFHIWQKREELPVDVSIRPYLFKAMHNTCLNFLKHQKVEEKRKEISYKDYGENLNNDNSETNALHDKIRQSIDKLPPERRKIFIMHRYENLKYKEIAEKLNISIKTVENQIGKALAFLREDLKNYLPLLFILYLKFLKIF